MIVINDRGILFNSRKYSYISFSDEHQGLYFFELGKHTLATFLLRLNKFPQCEMRNSEPVLNYYFKNENTMTAILNKNTNKELIDLG